MPKRKLHIRTACENIKKARIAKLARIQTTTENRKQGHDSSQEFDLEDLEIELDKMGRVPSGANKRTKKYQRVNAANLLKRRLELIALRRQNLNTEPGNTSQGKSNPTYPDDFDTSQEKEVLRVGGPPPPSLAPTASQLFLAAKRGQPIIGNSVSSVIEAEEGSGLDEDDEVKQEPDSNPEIFEESSGNETLPQPKSIPPSCLLCSKEQLKQSKETPTTESQGEKDAFFVLQRLLKIPMQAAIDIIRSSKDDDDGGGTNWFGFCEECHPLIEKAYAVRRQIKSLEKQLDLYGEAMTAKIRSNAKPSSNDKEISTKEQYFKKRIQTLCQNRSSALSPQNKNEDRLNEDQHVNKAPVTQMETVILLYPTLPPPPPLTMTSSPASPSSSLTAPLVEQLQEDENTSYETDTNKYSRPSLFQFHENHTVAQNCSRPSIFQFLEDPNILKPKTYDCPLCPQVSLADLGDYIVHVDFHRKRPFQCTGCSMYLLATDEAQIESHKRLFHSPSSGNEEKEVNIVEVQFRPLHVPWHCSECPSMFAAISQRDLHERTIHSLSETQKKWICEEVGCRRKCWNSDELRLHRALEHWSPDALFGCDLCGLIFKKKSFDGFDMLDYDGLKSHWEVEHPEAIKGIPWKRGRACPYCGVVCPLNGALAKHLIRAHSIPREESYVCEVCDAKFPSYPTFAYHQKKKHNLRLRVCDQCGFAAKEIQQFKHHRFLKHGIVPDDAVMLDCPVEGCDHKTVTRELLRRHVRVHRHEKPEYDVRPFACRFCNKRFSDSCKLKRHVEIHKNAETKPYQCEICGNSFAVENYLYIHKRLSHSKRFFPSTFKKKPSTQRGGKRRKTCVMDNNSGEKSPETDDATSATLPTTSVSVDTHSTI